MQRSNSPVGDDGPVQGNRKKGQPEHKPYGIERRYVGRATGTLAKLFEVDRDWRIEGWWAKQHDRDHQLEKLNGEMRRFGAQAFWEYRAVDKQ